jgi:hypothetical protein
MADIIQIRRDTAANWTSANPTLAQGELGAETDTDKIKIGDGSTAWASLAYLIDTSGYVTETGTQTLTNKTLGATTLSGELHRHTEPCRQYTPESQSSRLCRSN